jgi:small subunit ribosomal protein S8
MNYKISDFIIRIKNASMVRRRKITVPYAKELKEIGSVLVKGGFLESIKEEKTEGKKVLELIVQFDKRSPVLSDVEIISKPSLRIYTSAKNIPEIQRKGMTTVVISTSKGIMMGNEAYKKGIGGEVLFKIW